MGARTVIESKRRDRQEHATQTWAGGRMAIALAVMLSISIVGYLTVDNRSTEYVFAHLGGVSVVGLLACGAAAAAMRRGYRYWKVFWLALLIPMALGVVAAVLFQPISCGGSVSLAAAVLAVITCVLIRPRSPIGEH